MPIAYRSGALNSKIAQLLQAYQNGVLPTGISIAKCIPPPLFFKARVPEKFEDILARGVLIDSKALKGTIIEGAKKEEWGADFNVNPEGYDKMMIPEKVMNSLNSNNNRNLPVCAGYIPTTFKFKSKAEKVEGGVKLESSFTVWRFHQLSPEIIQRCMQLKENRLDIGKKLHLARRDFPGPSFLIALPVASADFPDGPGYDGDPSGFR